MAIPLNIDYDKLWPTKHDGYVKIVEDLGIPINGGNRNVKIKFIDTGNEQIAQLANVKNANIRDRAKRDIIGKIFSSNKYGDFRILEKLGTMGKTNTMYKIKFINTGYETIAQATNIFNGNVKDPYAPSVYGVGYIGNIKNPSSYPEYALWCDMHRRVNSGEYRYNTYANVTVCKRWHYLGNFLHDVKFLNGYNKFIYSCKNLSEATANKYALDKDLLQSCLPANMHKIYSPETCCFIPISINSILAREPNKFTVHPYPVCIYNVFDTFYIRPIINNMVYDFGEYNNYTAAVNAYNYHCSIYGLNNYCINHIEYMPPECFNQYRVSERNLIRII